ncbi:hypothetical protein [Bradyrhizobium sp. McL0615]|uniref:hypothetical protein n=1 Tax=Bradyrhizobium sp. McL0615 TaxID=3415673 RepID=UPI003CF0895B
MSIHDLKTRMADVGGIETLTMGLEAGRIVLRWDGYSAAVDASASDAECEAAVRNAIKLPPVSLIPDKPAAIPVAAKANGAATMSTNPASAGASVKQMMEEHTRMMGEIQQAQLRILEGTLARQRETVAGAVGKIAQQIEGQTDEFLSALGQFSNDLG